MIKQQDALQFLKEQKDYSVDIVYCDPPYALGSEIIVRDDGKVDYKKAVDFMNKWSMPTGDYWDAWFKESYRTLKYGGYCIMFGMPRQDALFKYYAILSGFNVIEPLWWYFISGFPKATDLAKMFEKRDRSPDKVEKPVGGFGSDARCYGNSVNNHFIYNDVKTELGKKYEGYKYSIAPLKQVVEEIMIFQKPYKTGSCLHDVLAYENGDKECCCGALDIGGNRVGTEKVAGGASELGKKGIYGKLERDKNTATINTGRYPAQTFVSGINLTIMVLDDKIEDSIKNNIINYYDKLYLQNLREKVLSLPISDKKWKRTTLFKGVLLENTKDNDVWEKSSKLWKRERQENNREVQRNLEKQREDKRELSSVEGWYKQDERIYNRGLSELSTKILENTKTNVREKGSQNTTTQNFNVNTSQHAIKEWGDCSSQKWSERRQQDREFRDFKSRTSLISTQINKQENENTGEENRRFTERDIFIEKDAIPKEWLKYFSYSCDIYFSAAKVIDKQSGVSKHSGHWSKTKVSGYGDFGGGKSEYKGVGEKFKEVAGASRILHTCDFEKGEYDLYHYNSKVSGSERNAGCESMEDKKGGSYKFRQDGSLDGKMPTHFNSHPTLKPISLNKRILSLFKTPNHQRLLVPFAGAGSEVIGAILAGFNDVEGCEINPEYIEIANARIKHWTKQSTIKI